MSKLDNLVIGYGAYGITGPTTPRADGPCCGGMDVKYEIVTRRMETVGIFPDQHGVANSGKINASLFALVPELLMALKLSNEQFIGLYDGIAPTAQYDGGNRFADNDPIVQRVRAAIAKATGE